MLEGSKGLGEKVSANIIGVCAIEDKMEEINWGVLLVISLAKILLEGFGVYSKSMKGESNKTPCGGKTGESAGKQTFK